MIRIQRVDNPGGIDCLQIENEGFEDTVVEIRLVIKADGSWVIERVTTKPPVEVRLGVEGAGDDHA